MDGGKGAGERQFHRMPVWGVSSKMINGQAIFFFFFMATPVANGRLGVKLELQLPAYPTATVTLDLSRICDLFHFSIFL